MRCVIYLRVSTKEQAEKDLTEEGFSIAAQHEACVRRIRDEGWELVDEYVDKGESARSADRPRLRAMLARVQEDGDVEAVVVHRVDRLPATWRTTSPSGRCFAAAASPSSR